MKTRTILFIAAVAMSVASCKKKERIAITMTPDPGFGVSDAKPVQTKVHLPVGYKADSVVYFLDSVRLGVKTDTSTLSIPTVDLKMGLRTISAKVYKDGDSQLGLTNFYVLPTQWPERMTYKIVKKFPHDTSALTQGLSYDNGFLYESVGDTAKGEIRKVELETGKVVASQKLGSSYFGRGNTVVGNDVIVLADREKIAFVFDKNTLKPVKQLQRFAGVSGWGLAYNGTNFYQGDGTGHMWILDKNFHQVDYIEAYDHESLIKQLGEPEFIDGNLYAFVYGYDTIIQIDPKGGAKEAVNVTNLWPDNIRPKGFNSQTHFLNGLAWDAKGKRIFVTGEKWPFVYQIEFVHYNTTSVTAK